MSPGYRYHYLCHRSLRDRKIHLSLIFNSKLKLKLENIGDANVSGYINEFIELSFFLKQ